MLLSKEYVGYLAREVTKKLIAGKLIETKATAKLAGADEAQLINELKATFIKRPAMQDELRGIK